MNVNGIVHNMKLVADRNDIYMAMLNFFIEKGVKDICIDHKGSFDTTVMVCDWSGAGSLPAKQIITNVDNLIQELKSKVGYSGFFTAERHCNCVFIEALDACEKADDRF